MNSELTREWRKWHNISVYETGRPPPGAGALSAAIEIIRRDITAHPLRFVTTWRPGRHYPRFTIKKVRTRKSNDVVPAATRLHLLPLPATSGSQQPNAPPAA